MSKDDAAIIVSGAEWESLESEVNGAIEVSLLSGTPDAAMALGRAIRRSGQLRGVQLARLLYEIDQVWDKFKTDDRVEDAVERDIGIPKDTFLKYARMYRFVLKDRPELAGKPVEGLIKLTAAAREGEFSEEHWKEIRLAPTVRAMLDVRDKVRGIQTSGHSRLVIWRTPSGQLYCKKGSAGTKKNCGYLPPTTGDDDIDAAVERLLGSAGVINQ